jgi:hypothetical protein
MTVHHIMRDADQQQVCPYCGRRTDGGKWESVFDNSNFHYKMHRCECGRKVTVKVDFMGSGHDCWSKGLDRRIEEVEAKSLKK